MRSSCFQSLLMLGQLSVLPWCVLSMHFEERAQLRGPAD